MNLEVSVQISKNAPILNFINIDQMETELFHADGRTDGQGKANSSF
jgi:hypothetical protein